ncbi:uncharacterized protein TNCV_3297571 [Trichonephila clavipes]|uniref:Retrotransposon gag domain-containing protein n=1 Tax=Trichonephila clavipes TaxID=2585209 RepID=A0A8X7B7F7_TRICX|nr:uncharacterized protein TNCV_3297571 [Trichonephila clavipes]
MQKGLEEMQKSQEETKKELKDKIEKGLENVQKCQDLKNSLEKKIDSVEEKINTVEDRIAGKWEQEIAVVEEKMKKKVEEKIERFGEEVAGNFNLVSQRVEKKLLACGNESKSKIVPVSAFSEPVSVTTFTGPVKQSTYDGKTNWEVYKTQFSIISEANAWTEEMKACQLAASLRREAAEILQTLPDKEQLNLNSLYNALSLRFGQKYSKEYARLQRKTRPQKNRESLLEYASEVERLANLAFSDHRATVRETISLQYFVEGLREGEVQKAERMADVQDLKSALKLEAATQANRRDGQSIRGASDLRCSL